jgi:hypothetical protein
VAQIGFGFGRVWSDKFDEKNFGSKVSFGSIRFKSSWVSSQTLMGFLGQTLMSFFRSNIVAFFQFSDHFGSGWVRFSVLINACHLEFWAIWIQIKLGFQVI